jgi:CheY-like chemotaxis protein
MSSHSRSLILIADVPEGAEIVKSVLSPLHDLVLVHSLTAATRLIANVDFDVVISGTLFDDSRMIELLRAVRTEPRFADKPFVVLRVLPTTMTPELEANAKQMATVLGANAYITIDDLEKDRVGGASFEEVMLNRLQPLLLPVKAK